jgi:ABC-type branched-subunit amino acid transport system ATPase component
VQKNRLEDGVYSMEDKTMLKVENLSVNYGHIEALKNVSVDVKKGQI